MEGTSEPGKSVSTSFLPNGDPGTTGGGTYNGVSSDPSIQDYENVFGPAARDIKQDPERNRRRQRWHLPDALQGSNPYLADRIDGLITDTTSSPFTTLILPYKHIDNVDGKIKWNVWSFDEGMASRVPYESSARVLTQTKRQFAGYTVRQGLAIVMEANFMMSPKGQENFRNQVQQVVHSIQYTNNLDVHVALIQAPSYQKHVDERYWNSAKSSQQLLRDYIDMFGFVQKNPNALDIAIEEAKEILRSWGSKEPTFMLCNSKLTMQLTMTPERTQYFTQGYDGIRRLKQGPNIEKYRGLQVIHSHSFSVETGSRPRDLLTRRVRVGEYYRIHPCVPLHHYQYQLYDEARDSWFTLCLPDLIKHSKSQKMQNLTMRVDVKQDEMTQDDLKSVHGLYCCLYEAMYQKYGALDYNDDRQRDNTVSEARKMLGSNGSNPPDAADILSVKNVLLKYGTNHHAADNFAKKYTKAIVYVYQQYPYSRDDNGGESEIARLGAFAEVLSRVLDDIDKHLEFVILRPNIEHNMYGIILGRGGEEDLGATLWGQTQLECYSDSVHGIWGMSYKYNERAIVFNEKNLIRLWDIAYCSYSGGKDSSILSWDSTEEFLHPMQEINQPYTGPSLVIMGFDAGLKSGDFKENWPSPVTMLDNAEMNARNLPENDITLPDNVHNILKGEMPNEYEGLLNSIQTVHGATKIAGECAHENIAAMYGSVYFEGSMRVLDHHGKLCNEIHGSGHHGPDYVGVASKRNGKGMITSRGAGFGVFAAT